MTTTERNDILAQARRRYLAEHPIRMKSLPTVDMSSDKPKPGPEWTFPDIGDIQIVGCKLGMEYLAICHDDEAVEDWIHTCMSIVKDPELAGLLFANVFRGINTLLGSILDRPGLREHLQRQAVDAWRRDFSEPFDDEPQTSLEDVDVTVLDGAPWRTT